jgi:hypothetical protein
MLVTTLLCLGVAVAACDQNKNRATQDQNPNNVNPQVQPEPRRAENPQDKNAAPDKDKLKDLSAQIDTQKKDYHAKIDAELKDLDPRIDAMKDAIDKEKGAPKDLDKKLLEDVKNRRDALKSDLHEIDSAKDAEWPAVKLKAERDLDDLRHSFRTASTRIHVASPRGVTNPQPGNAPQQQRDK